MATTSSDKPERREMKVLAMGLPRTGSASMAKALEVLGFDDVYHGIKTIKSPRDWKILNRACDATFAHLPSYTGKPFSRDDWEELYGPYEATTDVAAVFGRHLVEVYPDAKVVLVIRDFDPWFKSINEGVLKALWNPAATFAINVIEPIIGSEAGPASRKLMLGLFRARDVDECRHNAKDAYDSHHRELREAVSPGQLLEYRMGDGWEPLCKFLGKPVPEGEFPWVNEAAELKKVTQQQMTENAIAALKKLTPWAVGVVVVGIGSWMWASGGA